jgi:type I restriction enzyme S subunit
MNTKQLRQKILDLAIRGKLVPQDPNDEPASILLERVRAEKERCVKASKGKSDKGRMTADKSRYEQFEIPDSWAWSRLGDICFDFQYGTSKKSDKHGEVAVLRMGNLQDGEVDYNDLAFTSDASDIEKYSLNKNELLFNRTNSPEWVGKTAIYRGDVPAIFAGYIISVKPIIVNPFYLNYLMNSGYHQDVCAQVKTDGVNQSNINAQKLSNFIYPIPPLAEQNRIVAAIASAFAVIDEIKRSKADMQAAIAAARSKILSLAIRGKLVPQDPADEPASVLLERIRAEKESLIKAGKIKRNKNDSIIVRGDDNSYYGELPTGWAVCCLHAVGQIVGGGTPRTDELSYWNNGTIPWITPADLSGYTEKYISAGSRKISEQGLAESSATLIPPGAVLFSSRAPIGYIVIAANEICTNQGFKSVCPYIDETREFLYYFLKAQTDEIISRASGTTFKEISGTELGNTIITFPPLREQQRIVVAIELAFKTLNEIAVNLS